MQQYLKKSANKIVIVIIIIIIITSTTHEDSWLPIGVSSTLLHHKHTPSFRASPSISSSRIDFGVPIFYISTDFCTWKFLGQMFAFHTIYMNGLASMKTK